MQVKAHHVVLFVVTILYIACTYSLACQLVLAWGGCWDTMLPIRKVWLGFGGSLWCLLTFAALLQFSDDDTVLFTIPSKIPKAVVDKA